MNLKASFFNKSLFKSDIKRFWWVSVIQTILLFVVSVLPIYEECTRAIRNNNLNVWRCEPHWDIDGIFLIPIIFAIGVAVLIFTYMHFTASVSTIHSLPMRRGTILSTKFISGLTLTMVPIIINALCFIFIILSPEYSRFFSFADVCKWVITGFIYTLLLFSLTSFVNMMTGNPIGTIVFTCGFILLPLIFTGFFQSFFDMELYGYTSHAANDILNHIYIAESNLLSLEYGILYILFILIFIAGSYILYRIRKLETFGEVISFSWLKPVFIGIISILTSMLSYFYFIGILNKESLFWLLPFGILGTIIAWMISKKSISLKGVLKPLGIYILAALCFIGIIHFDLTGFERRVPELSDIESVRIVYDNTQHRRWYNNEYVNYWLKGEISPYFTEQEDIANVINLHKYLTKTEDREFSGNTDSIPIVYNLKNGKTLKREYVASLEDDAALLKPLYETKQIRANRFNLVDDSEKEFIEIKIIDRRFKDSTFAKVYPDNQYMQKLIDALKQDLYKISYDDMTSRTDTSIQVAVEYKSIYEFDDALPEDFLDDYLDYTDNEHINIKSAFKNTIGILQEMGLYSAIPDASDIEGASIYTWKNNTGKPDIEYTKAVTSTAVITSETSKQNEINVTDSQKIAKLYSLYDKMIEERNFSNYETCENIRISYRLKNGHTFDVSCSYDSDKIPAELSEYFIN